MTTAQTTADKFDRMVLDFKKARYAYNNARLGSTKAATAERKMERLVGQAEKMGCLDEFVRTVNNYNR
jgi:hypothetical protein